MARPLLSMNLREIARACKPRFVSRLGSSTTYKVHCEGEAKDRIGLVLGVYSPTSKQSVDALECQADCHVQFTGAAERYNTKTKGKLLEMLQLAGPMPDKGITRLFFNLEPEFTCVVVVGLGPECAGYNESEELDEEKENIRIAAAAGCQVLQEIQIRVIRVESFGNTEASAEGAALSLWLYQELKAKGHRQFLPRLEMHDNCDFESWQIGLQKAAAQNLARQLMETPANLMSPTIFAQNAVQVLCQSNVNVEIKVRGWLESQKMGAFLSVAKGSCEQPIFLEISYYGTDYDERPIVLVGSGVTFDSGGLCLKKPHDMKHMRADMAGAAIVVASTRAIARLGLPINIRGLIPLCENMPGCLAMKPGDIVTSMSGKRILIENTDCEGRLAMADTLFYAQHFWPRFILDVGTLTKDVRRGLGAACTGVFTNSDELWKRIHMAGVHTGDRLWRLPLWNYYRRQVTESSSVDMKSVGRGLGGGASKAASFLKEFVECGEWIHMDAYNVMTCNGINFPYLRKGMSGRPTRTIVEFLSELVCDECN